VSDVAAGDVAAAEYAERWHQLRNRDVLPPWVAEQRAGLPVGHPNRVNLNEDGSQIIPWTVEAPPAEPAPAEISDAVVAEEDAKAQSAEVEIAPAAAIDGTDWRARIGAARSAQLEARESAARISEELTAAVAAEVRRARASGASLNELARELGISRPAVAKLSGGSSATDHDAS